MLQTRRDLSHLLELHVVLMTSHWTAKPQRKKVVKKLKIFLHILPLAFFCVCKSFRGLVKPNKPNALKTNALTANYKQETNRHRPITGRKSTQYPPTPMCCIASSVSILTKLLFLFTAVADPVGAGSSDSFFSSESLVADSLQSRDQYFSTL